MRTLRIICKRTRTCSLLVESYRDFYCRWLTLLLAAFLLLDLIVVFVFLFLFIFVFLLYSSLLFEPCVTFFPPPSPRLKAAAKELTAAQKQAEKEALQVSDHA